MSAFLVLLPTILPAFDTSPKATGWRRGASSTQRAMAGEMAPFGLDQGAGCKEAHIGWSALSGRVPGVMPDDVQRAVGWALRGLCHAVCIRRCGRNAHAVSRGDRVGKIAGRGCAWGAAAAGDLAHPTVRQPLPRAALRCRSTRARSSACCCGVQVRNPSPDFMPSLPWVTRFSR